MPPERARADVVACTVVARNYLPAARVLAQSYVDNHPSHRFVIGLIDAGDVDSSDGPIRTAGPASFGIDEDDYLRMATAYSVTELATAVKPYLLRELRKQHSVVTYLDPDIVVCSPMPEVPELARDHGIVLVPHHIEPMPRDGMEPGEQVMMGTGVFNLGFVSVGPGSETFLDFWAERLRHDSIVAPAEQLFTDQRWVDQVPALFRHVVVRDPGFDVAYWNLHERPLTARDGAIYAGGARLRFFHFSGYRPERPHLLTLHCARRPRVLLSSSPLLRRLCDDYGAALRRAGYAETLESVPYGFARAGDGFALTPTVRRLFRDGWIAAERPDPLSTAPPVEVPPHAFGPDGGAALRRWLTSPSDAAERAAGLHRLAMSAWRSRTDLQLAFPRPTSADADDFRGWCATSGIDEGLIPDWAAPRPRPAVNPATDAFGVNIVGYLTAELGLGEMARIVHGAIEAAGIDTVSVVEERSLSNRTQAVYDGAAGRPRFGVSIVAVNADQTPVVLANFPEAAYDRYVIGLWAWELEDFPKWQHDAFAQVDEVWTVSDFCRDAIGAHATVPVKTMPVPVKDPGVTPPPESDTARFLFAFDFNSVAERKNPWGVVEAFRTAFANDDEPRLTIKAINGDRHPLDAERLRVAVADDPRIELIEHYVTASELDSLYASSTCYVSLHRSEGFGLTVAEAMARGLPVIATDYSSTTEFFDASAGWPIPYRLVSVGKGHFPYQEDAVWADPDIRAAADAMRAVAADPDGARQKGLAGRQHLMTTRTMEAASKWFDAQLHDAHDAWRRRKSQAADTAPPDVLEPVKTSKAALHWRPDPSTESRNRLAPALRRAVIRAIDHYDVHQRRVMGALADGTEQTAERLLDRVEQLEARLAHAEKALQRSASTDELHDAVDRAVRPALNRWARTDDELHRVDDTVARLQEAVDRLSDEER